MQIRSAADVIRTLRRAKNRRNEVQVDTVRIIQKEMHADPKCPNSSPGRTRINGGWTVIRQDAEPVKRNP